MVYTVAIQILPFRYIKFEIVYPDLSLTVFSFQILKGIDFLEKIGILGKIMKSFGLEDLLS
jgi:hypothetical protein